MSYAIALHALAALVWVGGMFFAWMVLRPVAAAGLEPSQRLPLWAGCFDRFFPWVWGAVVLLPATGYWIIFGVFGGMGNVGLHVHVMNGLAFIMIALFVALYFLPYRQLKRAVAAADWAEGAKRLAAIRRIVGINLLIGLTTVVVASGGRWFAGF